MIVNINFRVIALFSFSRKLNIDRVVWSSVLSYCLIVLLKFRNFSICHAGPFLDWVGGLNEKRPLDDSCGMLSMDVAPYLG